MERLTLWQMILNKLEDGVRGYSNELADIAGFTGASKGSNLKKVLRDEKKEFDNFNGLVNLVKCLFGEDEQKLMEAYSKTIDPNNKTARAMLEYLYCNRKFESLKELINKMADCKNAESREWSKLYDIQYKWQVNFYDLDLNEFLKSLNQFKTNIPELIALVKIMKCNCFRSKKAYNVSYELSNDILLALEDVKEGYIKLAYETKYNEIMSYLSSRVLNKPDEAIQYAENVLEKNVSKNHNAFATYIKGCSYFFSSYDESLKCFNESIKIYEEIDRKQVADDIREISELLDVVWDKDIFTVNICKEYKYYWLVKNNKLNNEVPEDLDAPFYFLVKGMKENSTELLMQSLIKFIKRGDTFLGTLPKIELVKRGYSQIIINEIINLHMPERG